MNECSTGSGYLTLYNTMGTHDKIQYFCSYFPPPNLQAEAVLVYESAQ